MPKIGFGVGKLTDDYLTPEDQTVMEGSFNRGMMSQQGTMRGSKADYERTSVQQGAGLNQPVAKGTKERKTMPVGRNDGNA